MLILPSLFYSEFSLLKYQLILCNLWQGLKFILSMWNHPATCQAKLLGHWWWCMAGLAPSMNSTRSSHCLLTLLVMDWVVKMLHLRSSVHPFLAMASLRLPISRVSARWTGWNTSMTLLTHSELTTVYYNTVISNDRLQLSSCCSDLSQADAKTGIPGILSTGRRLGIPHHHNHGPDAAKVSGGYLSHSRYLYIPHYLSVYAHIIKMRSSTQLISIQSSWTTALLVVLQLM